MDIDMSILRMLEREKEISFDVLVEAIEQALLTAYQKTPGAYEEARVELDRKTLRTFVSNGFNHRCINVLKFIGDDV